MPQSTAEKSIPTMVKVLLGLVVAPAVLDTVLGYSTPQLVLARLVLAAGMLRGIDAFRQLLRIMSVFGMLGAVAVLIKGGWILAPLEFVAAAVATGLLGSKPVRDWCHQGSRAE